MIKKLPIIGSQSSLWEILSASRYLFSGGTAGRFASRLAVTLGAGKVYTLNSGIACFYVLLETLKKFSTRREVVLPAYTAGSLVVAVKKAGLTPVLCDISLEDFNADRNDLLNKAGSETLAVTAVHMFGIPAGYIRDLKSSLPGDVYLIEDCCQAGGARVEDSPAGVFSDAAFYSFNRGKNFPANNGGCITLRNGALCAGLEAALAGLPRAGVSDGIKALAASSLFCMGTNPFVYGLAGLLARAFRETLPPSDIGVSSMGSFQAALGLGFMKKADSCSMKRYLNGIALLKGLSPVKGVSLPRISCGIFPVFNRFPLLINDPSLREKVKNDLWLRGVESSYMYNKPLHHMFELGYSRGEFPNACYLSERLLTLPVHPGVDKDDIETMIDAIRSSL